ncbi:potassium channel family protein [Halorubrum salipaludis]|uniref:potassium channel family protein n=1 Tax=Halorubrum salipaludis TaxID=2032630 RepID=UPI0018E99E1F|nr:NAD(P)-binding protein [Halorubrum salipaludis]
MSVTGRTLGGSLIRRALRPVLAFLLVVVVGVWGFVSLAGVGPIEAAFWLIDPASISVHYQARAGDGRRVKAFATVVFGSLVIAGVWIGETVLTTAFGGQMREGIERMQTKRAIDELDDHVIICGYGLFGRTVTRRLRERGRPVVAIERDRDTFGRIDTESVFAVEGDARNESVLREAAIREADAVVAAIDDSNANIQIAITASGIAPDVQLVVRVGDDDYTSVARRAGADEVVIPEVSSGEDVSDSL